MFELVICTFDPNDANEENPNPLGRSRRRGAAWSKRFGVFAGRRHQAEGPSVGLATPNDYSCGAGKHPKARRWFCRTSL